MSEMFQKQNVSDCGIPVKQGEDGFNTGQIFLLKLMRWTAHVSVANSRQLRSASDEQAFPFLSTTRHLYRTQTPPPLRAIAKEAVEVYCLKYIQKKKNLL